MHCLLESRLPSTALPKKQNTFVQKKAYKGGGGSGDWALGCAPLVVLALEVCALAGDTLAQLLSILRLRRTYTCVLEGDVALCAAHIKLLQRWQPHALQG
eukprot:4028136-Pyramimonas_sp.AAC.2